MTFLPLTFSDYRETLSTLVTTEAAVARWVTLAAIISEANILILEAEEVAYLDKGGSRSVVVEGTSKRVRLMVYLLARIVPSSSVHRKNRQFPCC